jgi:P pilus assembly chaperone PapD
MLSKKTIGLSLILLTLFSVIRGQAQVTISPTAMFFENNFSSFVVINNSGGPQEILIEFAFGYPKADENGVVSSFMGEDSDLISYSVTPYVRAFPRAVTLEAGQRQTIRLNIRPPADLAPGVYWSRLIVTSTGQTAEITSATDTEMGAQLNIVFRQIFPVYYAHRQINADWALGEFSFFIDEEDNHQINYEVINNGNTPFVGTLTINVTDSDGRQIYSNRSVTSIFRTEKRSFAVTEPLASGQYNVEISMDPRRPDISERNSFPMEIVTKRSTLIID